MFARASSLVLFLFAQAGPAALEGRASEPANPVEVVQSLDESTPAPLTDDDRSFLSFHQEEGADLAGAEVTLEDDEMIILILGIFAAVLLLVILL